MRTFWDKVKDHIWLKLNWYSCDLTAPSQHVMQKTDVHFRLMRQEDLDRLFQRFPKELTERKYHILHERLHEDKMEVFVAETPRDDMPVGFFCTSVTDTYVGEIRQTLPVPAGTVYLFDDYVFEQYRGRRIHGQSVRFRAERYRQRGYIKALVCIVASNDASINSYRRNGFQYNNSVIRIGLRRLGYTFGPVHKILSNKG